jgi:hypothetical protein
MRFNYVLDKIKDTEISQTPFEHIKIESLFEQSDFDEIIKSPEILLPRVNSDKELFDELFDAGYKIISFPGCTTKISEYIKWHESKKNSTKINTACEGFGVVLRLKEAVTPIVTELVEFLNSDELKVVIAQKFNIDQPCTYDAGVQKYLDGYEISPHPDIRRKAATYMVNINPHSDSEKLDHHTHYLKFNLNKNYVKEYWLGNKMHDRCWVPWSWCSSIKKQVENNSMVLFSPSDYSMHGVKANYDHLAAQRTQLYGNLWYEQKEILDTPRWEDLEIKTSKRNKIKTTAIMADKVPDSIKGIAKKIVSLTSNKSVSKRDY